MKRVLWMLAVLTASVTLSGCGSMATERPPAGIELSTSQGQAGGDLDVTFRGLGRSLTAADVTVKMNGFVAEVQSFAASYEGDALGQYELTATIPRGVSGWVTLDITANGETLVFDRREKTLFVGTVLTSLDSDLQAVQDALDALEPGGAVLIPAGTYSGNEPEGGLVLDNRLLVGSGEAETVLEGVTNVSVYARSVYTAGVSDLTIEADTTELFGGAADDVLQTFGFSSTPWNLGRFLVQDATWTGTGAIVEPTIDPDTLEVTELGEATGVMTYASRDLSDSGSYNGEDGDGVAVTFDGATVILNLVSFSDAGAAGDLSIVDTTLWTESSWSFRREAGDTLVSNSFVATVGGDSVDCIFEVESGHIVIENSDVLCMWQMYIEVDDVGDRTIRGSRLRAQGTSDSLLDFPNAYYGHLVIEDSWLYSIGQIDLFNVYETGTVTIVDTTLTSEESSIRVELNDGGDILIERSTLTSLASGSSYIDVETSTGTVTIVDSTFTSNGYIYVDVDDAGELTILGSSLTSTESGIELYIDYGLTFLMEDSTLTAISVDFDWCSCGATDTIIRNSTVLAAEWIEINNVTAGNVVIEDSKFETSCSAIDITESEVSSIYLTNTTLKTGADWDGYVCDAEPKYSEPNITIDVDMGEFVFTNVTIDSAADVLIATFAGGHEDVIPVPTDANGADLTVSASSIAADGNVRIGSLGVVNVLASNVEAGGEVRLASIHEKTFDTTGSTFTPEATLVTEPTAVP